MLEGVDFACLERPVRTWKPSITLKCRILDHSTSNSQFPVRSWLQAHFCHTKMLMKVNQPMTNTVNQTSGNCRPNSWPSLAEPKGGSTLGRLDCRAPFDNRGGVVLSRCGTWSRVCCQGSESGVIGLVAGAAMAAAFCWSAARGFATSTVFAVAGLAFIGIATCTSMLKSVDVSLPLL